MPTRLRIAVNQIRERINLRIYDSKVAVVKTLRYISVPLSLLSVAALIVSHGYALEPSETALVDILLKTTIGFYIFKYFAELFYDFSPAEYVRKSRFEFSLMLYMLVNIAAINIFNFELTAAIGNLLGVKRFNELFMLLVQGYFLVFVALELGKASRLLPQMKLSPPALLAISFSLITLLGAGLLAMPEMSRLPNGLSALDALFTSVSAVCVTGLSTFDIATVLTFKGKVILMVLIQLGGLNFITFTSLFALLANPGVGTRYKSMLQASYSAESLETSVQLTGQIVRFSLLFEAVSAALLFISWGDQHFATVGDRIFHSLFHAISAFNNAGFSLYTGGLADESLLGNVPLGLVIALTVVLGGLGFRPIYEVFSYKALKHRRSNPWVHFSVNTKIAVYAIAILVPLGALLFFILEQHGTLAGQSPAMAL